MDYTSSSSSEHDVPRRSFLTKFLAVVIGGVVSLVPFVSGLAVFLDPLRSRKKRNGGESDGPEGFIRVANLDGLLVGKPRRFTVIDDRVDAWNLFPKEPVGAVYLVRSETDSVIALNVECPHAGCAVDFSPDREIYQCPCHDSSFDVDGSIFNENSPSARALDSLEVHPEKLKSGEVWVKFQKFLPGRAEKIPVEA
ncbi:MAG: Rieske (2Fe-2S) protein [Planctomycetes bacterium]|nr:Rieske (2Fe-2S) protein [Planctomycetota bacterium]